MTARSQRLPTHIPASPNALGRPAPSASVVMLSSHSDHLRLLINLSVNSSLSPLPHTDLSRSRWGVASLIQGESRPRSRHTYRPHSGHLCSTLCHAALPPSATGYALTPPPPQQQKQQKTTRPFKLTHRTPRHHSRSPISVQHTVK